MSDQHSIDRHPVRSVLSPDEYSQLVTDVQLCRVSWPVALIIAEPDRPTHSDRHEEGPCSKS